MRISNKWKTQSVDDLFSAIISLNNTKEAANFFRDLLTEPELLEFANRWKVARLLSKNTPYSQIEKQTGMSSTTIARISKWLNKGMGGYKQIIFRQNKLHKTHHPA